MLALSEEVRHISNDAMLSQCKHSVKLQLPEASSSFSLFIRLKKHQFRIKFSCSLLAQGASSWMICMWLVAENMGPNHTWIRFLSRIATIDFGEIISWLSQTCVQKLVFIWVELSWFVLTSVDKWVFIWDELWWFSKTWVDKWFFVWVDISRLAQTWNDKCVFVWFELLWFSKTLVDKWVVISVEL